jgi:hypothetical protein
VEVEEVAFPPKLCGWVEIDLVLGFASLPIGLPFPIKFCFWNEPPVFLGPA